MDPTLNQPFLQRMPATAFDINNPMSSLGANYFNPQTAFNYNAIPKVPSGLEAQQAKYLEGLTNKMNTPDYMGYANTALSAFGAWDQYNANKQNAKTQNEQMALLKRQQANSEAYKSGVTSAFA